MRRIRYVPFALLVLASPALAQPAREPKDGKVVYPMALSPTPARKPLSRDYLMPEYGETIQGNKVQMFLRCFMEQDNFFGREESERRQKWNELPINDPALKAHNDYGNRLVERDMYDAARMTSVDWQLWYFIRRDSYRTLLPDLQKFRALAEVLKTRVRGQIASRNFDGAIHTLKTMFALSKTMEQHPCLIGSLVGVAVATITINAVDEFIAQPGAPNLYWAVTDLDTPFMDLQLAMQGERMFLTNDFQSLIHATGPVTEQQLQKALDEVQELVKVMDVLPAKGDGPLVEKKAKEPTASEKYKAWASDSARVKLARARMIEYGLKPEVVKAMTPLQATLTDDIRRYEVLRDDLFRWVRLPMSESSHIEDEEKNVAKLKPDLVLAPALVASVFRVKRAQARLDQRIAYVRVIEAIRLHALDNGGKLPTSLAEIRLPLPNDPFNGKPFEYSVKDGVATLHGVDPQPGTGQLNRYYELTIRK